MLIETGKSFTQKSWSQWVNKKEATAIPGALGFLNYVDNQGVKLINIKENDSIAAVAKVVLDDEDVQDVEDIEVVDDNQIN